MQCCFPFGNTETVRSCHLERVPGQPDPLTLEHGYENCMANEYEFSTETKRS